MNLQHTLVDRDGLTLPWQDPAMHAAQRKACMTVLTAPEHRPHVLQACLAVASLCTDDNDNDTQQALMHDLQDSPVCDAAADALEKYTSAQRPDVSTAEAAVAHASREALRVFKAAGTPRRKKASDTVAAAAAAAAASLAKQAATAHASLVDTAVRNAAAKRKNFAAAVAVEGDAAVAAQRPRLTAAHTDAARRAVEAACTAGCAGIVPPGFAVAQRARDRALLITHVATGIVLAVTIDNNTARLACATHRALNLGAAILLCPTVALIEHTAPGWSVAETLALALSPLHAHTLVAEMLRTLSVLQQENAPLPDDPCGAFCIVLYRNGAAHVTLPVHTLAEPMQDASVYIDQLLAQLRALLLAHAATVRPRVRFRVAPWHYLACTLRRLTAKTLGMRDPGNDALDAFFGKGAHAALARFAHEVWEMGRCSNPRYRSPEDDAARTPDALAFFGKTCRGSFPLTVTPDTRAFTAVRAIAARQLRNPDAELQALDAAREFYDTYIDADDRQPLGHRPLPTFEYALALWEQSDFSNHADNHIAQKLDAWS